MNGRHFCARDGVCVCVWGWGGVGGGGGGGGGGGTLESLLWGTKASVKKIKRDWQEIIEYGIRKTSQAI